MDPLDPSVLAATDDSAAPLLDANLVKSVTPDATDPAWSSVEFADGRIENRPTADADAMPKMPEPLPGVLPPPVGAGNPPAVDPGFSLTPTQQAMTSTTPENTLAFGGAGGSPAPVVGGARFGQMQPATGGAPLVLPTPRPGSQPDPGSEVLSPGAPGGAMLPSGETESASRTENEFAVDPAQLAVDAQAEFDDINTQVDQRQRYDASVKAEAQAEAQRKYDEQIRRAEIFTEESRKALQVIEDTPVEQDFYKDSPGRQVAAWVALALSGFLTGATNGANPAMQQMMQALNAAQDRFISNQRADKNSKLAQRERALGSAQAAEASMRMQMPNIIETYARQHAAKVGMQELPPGLSTDIADRKVKALEFQQRLSSHVVASTDRRFSEERKAAPATGPVTRTGADLRAILGPQAEAKHAEAMDPKKGNLGGLVQGAADLERTRDVLQELTAKHGGTLPTHEGLTIDRGALGRLAARWGFAESKDAMKAQAAVQQMLLSIKQTLPIRAIDAQKEGEGLTLSLDPGTTEELLANIDQQVSSANQRAVSAASGYAPGAEQKYIDIIRRTQTHNPGAGGRQATSTIREHIVRPAPAAETGEAPASPTASTGEAPATRPLAGSRQEWRSAIEPAAREAGYNPEALSRVIAFESGGNPKAKNASGASGLIQFMPDVFDGMTKPAGYENVTHADLGDLTAEEQMPLVIRYLQEKGLPADADAGEMYLAVAAPALLGKPDDEVAYRKGSAAWKQNPSWRPASGGDITAGSIRAKGRNL